MRHELLKSEATKRFSVFSVISLRDAAIAVLTTEDILQKVSLTFFFYTKWLSHELITISSPQPQQQTSLSSPISSQLPNKPLRKNTTVTDGLLPATQKKNSINNLIHGIAHAESYAIELFWDCIGRYSSFYHLPREFYDEMIFIANQEAQHFLSWHERLQELNCPYGTLWSHDGLWKSAEETHHRYSRPTHPSVSSDLCCCSLLDRIAVVNLLHEARGLDTYPISLRKFQAAHDTKSIEILNRNYKEEIFHVSTALKWFRYLCQQRDPSKGLFLPSTLLFPDPPSLPPPSADWTEESCIEIFHEIIQKYFLGRMKGPFNEEAREAAGMTGRWYLPLSEEGPLVL
jgi:uncharacterized ferritin-like protein (DUF455 family)